MKVQNPIIGRARGSAGGMTFSKVYDKNVARAKAFEVNNPKTTAQQRQRAFFAKVTAVSTDLSDAVLRSIFPNKPKTMSRRNALSKQIAANYAIVDNEKVIDFEKIDTLGNASVMDFGQTNCVIDNEEIVVELDASVKGNAEVNDKIFSALVINETQGDIYPMTSCKDVARGALQEGMPATWENTDDVHAIPLIFDTTDDTLEVTPWGTVGVSERPVRKND